MSTFKQQNNRADRSAQDRARHKEKIDKAIREGIADVIAEESIIGQDGKKKIKIPVRGIKEYQFVYGDNESNQRVGSAPGKNLQRGQKIGKQKSQQKSKSGKKASNEPGVEYYEVEITLDELAAYLFDNLELPDLEKKQMQKICSEKTKRHGYRNDGIRPRLDKKQTMRRRIRRKKLAQKLAKNREEFGTKNEDSADEERFPFHEDDLRYKHIKMAKREVSNAVILFIMDVSGSMSKTKKYLARSFCFLIYQFIRHKYQHVDIVFIAHHTEAMEVDENNFFNVGTGGGTTVSAGLKMCHDIISKRYHPTNWNIYTFQCSDGDNWSEDNDKTLECIDILKQCSQLFGYCEIEPNEERISWMANDENRLSNLYLPHVDEKFKIVTISQQSDVWPSFKKLFGGKLDG